MLMEGQNVSMISQSIIKMADYQFVTLMLEYSMNPWTNTTLKTNTENKA